MELNLKILESPRLCPHAKAMRERGFRQDPSSGTWQMDVSNTQLDEVLRWLERLGVEPWSVSASCVFCPEPEPQASAGRRW